MRILVVGRSPTRSKGGMATVIEEIEKDKTLNSKFNIDIYESYIDGNKLKVLFFSLFSFIRFYFTKRNYDIYHIHAASYGSTFRKGLYVHAAKKWGKKVILHIHGAEYMLFYEKSNQKDKIVSILKEADEVIALSAEWKKKFDETFGLKNCVVLENGMVTSENYVLGYKASLIQGVTPGQIRERMEKLNPDRFRVRKFGVSDVIVTSIGGKTQSYYVNPKELIKFNGFFTKLPNGEYLLLNEEGYQVEGQKGTWTVTDEKTIDEQRFVLMVSDQKPDLLPSIVVQSDGKFMTTTSSGFDNATVRKVRELLHHEKFLENGTAERARESGTEQNYNMIDGCVNNVPKKPRVIGGRVSVLDRLHIKQAERARKDNAQVQQQERTRKT